MPRLGNLAKALLALAVALAASALLASSSSPGRAASAPLVVIDPGHDRYANSATEPIGPGSSTMKIKDGGGTRGVVSGKPEAQFANRRHAAAFVRVHCDGSTSGTTGTHTLYPAYHRGWTDDIYKSSLRLAKLVQAGLVGSLGFPNRGLDARSDITGFNWANVPVILPELGFLTNPGEDRVLASSAGQQKAAVGMCRGILRFLGRAPSSCG
jgi:N-acetylmuramoyl-L-alanine amidase